MFHSKRFTEITNRILQILVLLYQGIALLAFLLIPFYTSGWLRMPFIGAFVEQTMMINQVAPQDEQAWGLLPKVPEFGYQVIQVAGTEVRTSEDIRAALQPFSAGDTVPVTLLTPSGAIVTHEITLQTFPLRDRIAYLYIPYLIGLVYLGVSLWIFGLRRSESAGRAFAIFASSVAIASASLFDVFTSHHLTYLWAFALALAGGAVFDLALAFPQGARLVIRRPYLCWIGYIIAMILGGYAATTLFDFSRPTAYANALVDIYIFGGSLIFFFFAMITYRGFASPSPVARNQARTILLGAVISFAPVAVWFLVRAIRELDFNPYLLLPLVIFPITTGYTILRYRLLRTDYLLRKGVLFALLSTLAVAAYILLVSGIGLILGSALPANHPLLIGLMILLLVAAFNPLRERLQRLVDTLFFRGERAYQQRAQDFIHELTLTVDLPAILRILSKHIDDSLLPGRLHIFIYDPLNDQYTAAAGEDGRPTSDIHFVSNSPLPEYLSRQRLPFFYDEANLPEALKPERTRLALLGVRLFIPLPGSDRLTGWLALDMRRSGEIYTGQDLNFLELLAGQAAIAIANTQLYSEVQAASVAKSEFVSFVAHELKNPMTSIKGYTELLAAGSVGSINEMQNSYLHTIRSNVERMSTLVSDLNDDSKIEAGRLRLDFKEVELDDLVDEVMRSTKRQFEEKNHDVAVKLPAKLPKVWADRTRLAQILTNLVSNAIKYTPEGGRIIIGAQRAENQWDPEGAAEVIHVWVQDTGIGISPEDQKKVFQKFFRSEDQKAREAPGTGLGLNLTRSLVEMQGGLIWFESQYRQGTIFHFTVPVAEE